MWHKLYLLLDLILYPAFHFAGASDSSSFNLSTSAVDVPNKSYSCESCAAQEQHHSSISIRHVIIADDNDAVREGLRQIIDSWPGLKVIGEAANGEDAIQ